MTQIINCYICNRITPVEYGDEHHRVPQAAGGKDKGIHNLCSGCHNVIHATAHMLMAGKSGEAVDKIKIYYNGQPGVQKRALDLANIIVEYMVAKKEGKIKPNETATITVEVPYKVKAALMTLGKEMRNGKGKRIGMQGIVSALVTEFVYNKYPELKKMKG